MEPPPILQALAAAPIDVPVALLVRHAERAVLEEGADEYYQPITCEGVARSHVLGAAIGHRLVAIHTSPLTRCTQTAEAIHEGAGVVVEIKHDRLLGDPGVFVVDDQLAGEQWARLGNDAMMDAMTSNAPPLPGLAAYREAAQRMLDHVREVIDARPGVHVFVTHDSILAGFVGQLVREEHAWRPQYLDGAALWTPGRATKLATRTGCASLVMSLGDSPVRREW